MEQIKRTTNILHRAVVMTAVLMLSTISVYAQTTWSDGQVNYTIKNKKYAVVSGLRSSVASKITILAEINDPPTYSHLPVTTISSGAFRDCSNLTELVISEGVTTIEDKAFFNCTGLTKVSIPSTVTSIGYEAFNNCISLTEVIIPEGVTTIEQRAFSSCTGLIKVSIPSTVTTIGEKAFDLCCNLTELVISEGVTTIGKRAFRNCTNLSKVSLPSTVTSIGEGAFSGCNLIIKHNETNVVVKIKDIPAQTYTGSAIEPELTIVDDETALKLGTDYTIRYIGNINKGTATVIITGIGNYSGMCYTSFDIKSKPLSASNVSDIADQTYTGSVLEPVVTVKDGNKTLVLKTDYKVEYSNNTNAGTATVTITGKGNYSGTIDKTFNIKGKQLTASNVSNLVDQTYTGSPFTPLVTVTDGDKTLVLNTDYTVAYINNTNVGTATATITGKGNYSGTIKKTFAIVDKVTTLGALTLTQDQNGITASIQGDFSSDESGFLEINSAFDVDKVTFNRSFSADIPATVMFPFSFDASKVNGKFYTLASVAPVNGVWTATMSDPIKGTIEANTPYIFKANSNLTKLTFEKNGSDKVSLQSTDDIKDNESGDWTLHGVYTKTNFNNIQGICYGFAGQATNDDGISIRVGQFFRAGEGVWADPMRCYLTYNKNNGVLAKSALDLPDYIRVVFPDEAEQPDNGEIITPVSSISENTGVKVWSYSGTIYIEAQSDMEYTIVDLSGRVIKTGVTHSTREEITLSAIGIVIVKIGNESFKLNN